MKAPITCLLAGCFVWVNPLWGQSPEIIRDFDQDGHLEKISLQDSTVQVTRQKDDGTWEKADFDLPKGLSFWDDKGRENGLHLVDLNDDGFDDLLLSNEQEHAIYLWTKVVKPQLGWAKGWTQPVRHLPRKSLTQAFPSLVGKHVTIEEGRLAIRSAKEDPQPVYFDLRSLIAVDFPAPKSPQEALKTLQARPGFQVQLVASEPQVVDPVAFDWDEKGRLWVVEMRDYPLGLDGKGKPGGCIKVLEDQDGDGYYEKATTFLENIPYPTGLLPWRKGVLIASSPNIILAEDLDGDLVADKQEILFSGFRQGNEQHLVNGFEIGLDGWIHGANGDSGGTVTSTLTGKQTPISGRDFRFKPQTGEFETYCGGSQYGRRRDDWGNWFGNNNSVWLWHNTLPEYYLKRNPKLAIATVRQQTAKYPDHTRVYPIGQEMIRPNQPWALNHVTSACSPAIYRDVLFPATEGESVFIAEPVHNLVHREVLVPHGASFQSRRAADEEADEFLKSDDPWFRPCFIKTGPDGALYVADMYRMVIEHPEWISPELQDRMDIRAGQDKGRIYRVVVPDQPLHEIPDFSQKTSTELAQAINHPNGWQRDMAMSLLWKRHQISPLSEETLQILRKYAGLQHAPQVRVQALATLGGLQALTPEHLVIALEDPHSGVRVEALRQSETLGMNHPQVLDAIRKIIEENDPKVLVQAAFSLGAWPPAQSEPLLKALAAKRELDPLLVTAIQTSLSPDSELFTELQSQKNLAAPVTPAFKTPTSSGNRAEVIGRYTEVSKLKGDVQKGRMLFQSQCAICHRFRNEGVELGPDLGMASTKTVDWLLTGILDPSLVVEARYRAWSVTLKSGQIFTGLIGTETSNNIVLRLPGGQDFPILRTDIQEMKPMAQSLMPEGLEAILPPQAMADLIAWLQSTVP